MTLKFPKKISKSVIAMLLVSVVVTVAFLVYLALIGIPTTQARNELNAGIILFERDKYDDAKIRIEKSLSIWKSSEAQDYLDQINKGN